MGELDICQDCFYNNRTNEDIFCMCWGKKLTVVWNSERDRLETTAKSIRPFPEALRGKVKLYVAMCDPYKGTCKRERCTFAHGKAEQKAWNQILREKADSTLQDPPNHQTFGFGHMPNHQQSHQPGIQMNSHWPAPVRLYSPPPPSLSGRAQPWPELRHQQQPAFHMQQPFYYQQPPNPYLPSPVAQVPSPAGMYQPFPPPSFQPPPPAAQPVHPAAHQSKKKAEWYAASEETFEKRLQQELNLADIQVELCQGNYKRKFHHLICWEEKTHVEILGNKCDQTCQLVLFSSSEPPNWIRSTFDYDARYGCLQNVSTDQIAYATQASEAAFIVPSDRSQVGVGEVRLQILRENFEHSDANLYVAFSESDSHKLSAIVSKPISGSEVSIPDVCVEFEVKHFYFDSLTKAVNKIPNEIIERILPTAESFIPLHYIPNDIIMSILQRSVTIDRENQWKALHAILAFDRSSPPLLINGSFGTGKTQVLAAATYCLIQYGIQHRKPVRVLICAHHQASADHFVEKYFGSMFEHTRDVVLFRLTSNAYRVKNSQFHDLYVKSFELKRYLGRNTPQFLVIVTTFLTAPSLRWSCDQNFFTHILLDEGSQSREPEAIAPLCLANVSTKIVIAGDSQQVGPSLLVLGEDARENGLKCSLLERLQILYRECGDLALDHMVSLDTNYRCREELIRIPNELFYGSKIKTKASPHQLPSMYTYPLKFVCSSITEETDPNREAMLLLEETRQFIASSRGHFVGEICAVTASRTQLVISRNVARNRFKDLRRIRMLTTYEIQGQEFQALFLSTTEPMDEDGNTTNPTKSPCDPYIFNTVLTRSKSLVVVVGNPVALLNIESHMKALYGKKARCWSSFIRLCLEQNSFLVPPEVEPDQLKRREFELRLKAKIFDNKVSNIANQLADFLTLKQTLNQQQHALPSAPNASAATSNIPNSSPAQRSFADASRYPTSSPVKSTTTSKPSQKSAAAAPGKVPKHAQAKQQQRNSLATARKQPTARPASKQPQSSSKTAGKVLCQEPVPFKQFQQGSPLTARRVSEQLPERHAAESLPQRPFGTMGAASSVSSSSSKKSKKGKKKGGLGVDEKPNVDDSSFPSLQAAAKVSKKEAKNMAAKESHHIVKGGAQSISSPNVSLPESHSSFYDEYKNKLESHRYILEQELTAENYKEKFHLLLSWEEQEHAKQLAERCDKVYDVALYQNGFIPPGLRYEDEEKFDRFGYITSDDGDTLNHAEQASQGSFIILDANSFVHAHHVYATPSQKVNVNSIIVGFTAGDHNKLKKSGVYQRIAFSFKAEVKFELKHSYFERCHKAVRYLTLNTVQRLNPTRSCLEPDRSEYIPGVPPYDNIKLDYVQLKALCGTLSSSRASPILIAGPFGTGKTRLLARAAYEILKGRNTRVLICAHHQTSVDTFVDYFSDMKQSGWDIGVIRVVPNQTYFYPDRAKKGVTLKTRYELSQNDLESNRLVIATLGVAPTLFFKLPGDRRKGFFTDILIDEGAQTREPEAVGPLGLAGRYTRIIVAGDHCQVGPKSVVLGEEAQSNGLGVSLLERLHALYDKFDLKLNTGSMTLLTNYRCHSGILMLPSSLYYHSTLQCRVPDSTAHHLAPFPLTFVCSSIQQDLKGTLGSDESEADAIVKEVQKYFKKWPKHWDEDREDRKVCIMSPSADQCSVLRRKTRQKNFKVDCHVEILKGYAIQGTQYRAVFISAIEPTSENGDPINTTKSLCDRYIFNTTITRSQSLVVVAGNPFLLLKMEANMIAQHDKSYQTWTPYIKQCMECNTFSYADSLKRADPSVFIQATHQLYQCVYRDTISEDSFTSRPLDSIIKAYKTLFESTPQCQKAKLSLTSGKDARLLWNIEEERDGRDVPAEDEEHYSDRYLCNLKMYTFRYAEGIPYDGSKSIVKFPGAKYRRGAFDGDTVEVGIFDSNPPGKCYGRILKVTERGSDLKFVCRVSTDDPIIFYPIDRKNPKLINLPRLSRDLLNKKERAEINRSDLKSNDVVVFSPLSHDTEGENDDVPLPQIVQVIPLSVARDMLFLVSFVRWEEKYRSPLGIVTGAYRKGHTLYNAERLLKFVHSVEYNSTGEGSSATVSDAHRDVTLDLYDRAFTIDPEDAQNLDDALSIIKLGVDKKGCKVYQLGVHIVNAARHITPGSEEDMRARNKGISVYGGDKGKIMHMLQSSLTRCQLSLAPGKVRDVITVTCTITVNDTITFGDVSIHPAQLLSSIQLTYKQAQEIIEGRTPDNCVMAVSEFDEDIDNPTLQQSLEILYNIARDRRQKRLQDAAFAYDVNETKEAHCWQTHLLVEELMIWANNEVAKHIYSLYPNTAILRKQAAPNEEAKNAIVDSNHSAMAFSFHLSQYLQGRDDSSVELKLAIPHSTLKQIHKALDENNSTLLAHLLSSDRLYPQLAAVCSEFRSISLGSVYCCTHSQASSQDYRHDSLHLDQYTHFTSPMRRYVDIEVQRMLLELSEQRQGREFIPEKQTELCLGLNTKKKNASDFERSLKNVRFARRLAESSEVCTAFISKEEKNSIELSFPDLELSNFPVQAKSLRITSFVSFSKDEDLYAWKVHITSLKSDFATGLLGLQGTSVHQFNTQLSASQDLVKAFTASSETSLDIERFSLSHDNSTVFVPSTQWAEVQEFVENPSARKMEKVRQIIPELPPPKPQGKGVSKIYQFLDCDIKASLKKSDVLKLWLTWSTREPVISPAVQLVEISPLLRICLQHNSHPAECFSDPNLLPASKPVYSSIETYVDLWKKVLLAEAAEKSVKECQPIIIRDVSLKWPDLKIPDNCIEDIHYAPTGPIKMTLPKHFIEHCYEFFRVGVGDLVCVRYGCDPHQSARAVYHFVIHEVKEKEPVCAKGSTSLSRILEKGEPDEGPKEITIAMVPVGEKNCRVSQVMRDQLQSPCEVQLMELSVSYRKVFRGLLGLSREKEKTEKLIKLSEAVAVDCYQIGGQTYPKKSQDITRRDELSKSISKWSSDVGGASTNLNKWQEEAMKMALSEPFQLIQGPPGTGKSVTGAHIAYVFAKLNKSLGGNKCVIYCGPSNKSVDVVFEKFVQLLESRNVDIKILRIYSSTVEKKDFPGPKYRTTERKPDVVCHDWARPYALHHLIRQQPKSGKLRELEEKIAGMKRNNEIATGKLCSEYNRLKQEAESEFLSSKMFDAVFCTCNEASGGRIRKNFKPRQCIIDECGMAYEPETIVPIDLCEHAVLIGDHKQLQPVIDYQPAKDCGLTTSLFERYAQHHDDFIFTLKTQYRMHEDICEFPSKEFYKEELETDISVHKRPPNERLDTFWRTSKGNTTPIMFVDVVGDEGQDKTGSSKTDTKVGVDSKYNMKEAELVVKIAKTLHQNYKVPVSEMAVLSPYSAQKSKILEMVKQLPSDLRRLKVASITESQGDEYGIVILSTVRSLPLEDIRHPHYVQADHTWMRENLGFITDRHQINVGITRSKYGLIITGNKTLLKYDRTWENLLKHYEEKGCVIPASRF